MTPDQMAMMAALLRRQQGPLAWDQTQPSDGSNGGQQRSNVGMSNMMNPMAKALMSKGAPKTYDWGSPTDTASNLPADAFSGGVPNAGVAGANGISEFGAGDLSALGSSGGSGALTEFGAGDLSALGTPAGSGGAAGGGGAGAGAMAGGLAAGAGSMLALAMFNNYFRQHHEMTAQDYLKQWGGQSFAAAQKAAQAHAAGDTATEKQYTALANTTKGLSNMTASALKGDYVPNVTTTRDPGYQRNAKPF